MDFKKEAVRIASTMVESNTSVGLGDGSTVRLLAEYLTDSINAGLEIRLYTSSIQTLEFLQQRGVLVHDISLTDTLDIYFDGCDQIDGRLNALKSGSGIHTMEKLLASMAKRFVIIGDESKFVQKLDPKFPLVLEVLPQAVVFIQKVMHSLLPGCRFFVRKSQGTDDRPVLTRHGNHLVDCYFQEWPDLENIQIQSKKITGIIEISLFYQMVNEAIIAGKTGITRYVA
ncbi:MAG TPA: ribose 5-phosphate isomerase A [Puia sp.]|jgi:ribose 5-phosphate isomerase A